MTICRSRICVSDCGKTSAYRSPRDAFITGSGKRGEKIELARDYYPWVREHASGIVDIDEVYEPSGGMIVATDPVADLTLDFCLAERIDDDVAKQFLRGLCGGGLPVRGAATDGSSLYRDEKLAAVWPGVVHQQCVFHLLKEANRDLLHAVAAVRKKLPKLHPRRRGRPCRRGRPRTERVDRRKLLREHRFLFTRRPDRLSDEDQRVLDTLRAISPQLATIRRFTDDLHDLLAPQQTPASARQIRDRMIAHPDYAQQPHLFRILKRLRGDKLEPFIAYLRLPGLERTTNHVESKNRRFRLIQKTRYKRRKPHTIANAMKLELMYQKHRWEQAHPAAEPLPAAERETLQSTASYAAA